MQYHEQIKHPLWQKKRLEVLELNHFQCQTCGAKDEELHVHHPFYKRGAMIWDYDKTDLESLCHRCHKDHHSIDENLKVSMSHLSTPQKIALRLFIDSMAKPALPKIVKPKRLKKMTALVAPLQPGPSSGLPTWESFIQFIKGKKPMLASFLEHGKTHEIEDIGFGINIEIGFEPNSFMIASLQDPPALAELHAIADDYFKAETCVKIFEIDCRPS